MRLKRFLFSLPVLIALTFLTALLLARPYFYDKPNDLIRYLSADAKKLNPILMDDNASSTVAGLVFNGLVKYDEDLNLVGELAESWDVCQHSRFFLKADAGMTYGNATAPAATAVVRFKKSRRLTDASRARRVRAPSVLPPIIQLLLPAVPRGRPVRTMKTLDLTWC